MKKFVLITCLLLIPLTLASETQRRFQIAVAVFKGKHDDVHDAYVKDYLQTRLKKELQGLDDVDSVEINERWHFALVISYFQHTLTEGNQKTGWISIADVFFEQIPTSYFRPEDTPKLRGIPVYFGGYTDMGVSLYQRDKLNEYCQDRVQAIDTQVLTPIRPLLR